MADVNANIGVNIDTSAALAQLKALQRQISQFHTSIAKSSETAALAQRDLQKNFLNSVNAIGAFSAELRTVKTTAESFTDSLQKNKFSMREYFRYAGASTKTFGKLFKSEFDTIGKVAEDRVKRLQTQYIKLGRDTSGAMKAIAIMPNQLDMGNFSTQSQMAAQKQAIFNQLVKQGSTNLLNFGKNTQWAGRQLMVGFTLPLATLGTVATRTFMEMEQATLKFRKVYGDLFTPTEETNQALENITALGQMFTKYGVAVSQTVGLAAEAAAAGFSGVDLQRQTTEATRLSVLGQIEANKALETTISLQNAFKMSSDQLAGSIDFLNAVENQTVVSLDDITTAIPKVAPVIQQLGGDVKDLAFFMAAMKEGGINASEGANALKSGLAALINPTGKASAMLAGYGINIKKIVEGNQGDLKATVIDFANALDTLDPLTRARAIEQLFGKFQFARLSTLFDNVTNQSGQAARVLELAGTSIEDLSALSEKELGMTADSAMNKFRKSVEDLKLALVPVGQTFLQAVTPIVEFIGGILERFNNLSDGVKKAIVVLTVAIGAIGPIALMTFGLLANGLANIVKGALVLRNGYLRLTGQTQILGEQTEYLTMEQIDAAAASHSLDQSHARLTQTFTAESTAVAQLIAAYQQATVAAGKFAAINPGMMRAPGAPTKRAKGKPVVVGGTGSQDTELALLTPGETVIPADMSKRYGVLINGMIAGNIPGYKKGLGSYGPIPTGVDNKPAQYGHITTRIETTVDEFLKELLALPKKLIAQRQTDINRLTGLQKAGGGQANVNTYTSLATYQSESLNQKIGKGTSMVPVQDFLDDFDHFGPGMFIPALKDGGATLQQVEGELTEYHKALRQAIIDKGKENKTNKITGKQYEQLESELRQTLPSTSKLRKTLDMATAKIDEYRINIPADIAQTIKKNNPNLITGQGTHESFITSGQGGKPSKIRLKGDRFSKKDILGRQSLLNSQATEMTDEAILATARAAGTQSPSKKTIPIGEDIARGLQVGMANQQDDVAASGQALGTAAVGGVSKSKGKVSKSSGGSPEKIRAEIAARSVVQQSAISSKTKDAIDAEVTARKTSAQKLDSMNKGLMASTFALTSLAGAGSMASGPIGNLSQQVMKFSGLLFALMSVTQLLTQAKFAELIANRAATAGLLKKTIIDSTTGAASFSKVTGLFAGGIKQLLPNLLKFGGMIAKVAGIPGLVVSAGIGIFTLVKMANKHREDERRAIMGLADAANMTSEKLATLGDIFGVVPTKNPLLETAPSIRMTTERRGKVEQLKSSEAFQKDFADTISGLREATNKEAEIALKSISLSLSGQGYTKQMIADVVDAIREEAGKTDVKIDLKSLDLGTEAGQKGFAKLAADMTNELAAASKNGFQLEKISRYVKELRPTVELQRAAAASGQTLFNMMTGLAGGLESGAISAKSFNQGFDQLQTQVKAFNAINPGSGLLMLKETIKLLNPETQKLFEGLEKDADIMLMMRAQALGLTYILPGLGEALKTINAGYKGNATELVQAQLRLEEYKNLILKTAKISEEEIKKLLGGGITPGDTKESAFALAIKQLQNQQKELINTKKAYDILKKAGFDAATATKYASDSVIALGLATGTISVKQINQVKTLMEDIERKAGSEAIKNFLDSLNTDTNLKERFSAIIPTLLTMGATVEDIENILQNPTLMNSFVDKFADAEKRTSRMKKYLDALKAGKAIDVNIELKLLTPEKIASQAEEEFKKASETMSKYFTGAIAKIQQEFAASKGFAGFSQMNESIDTEIFNASQRVSEARSALDVYENQISQYQFDIDQMTTRIQQKYDAAIENLKNEIAAEQARIASVYDPLIEALSREESGLQNDLALMDKQAAAINKKYDEQVEALEKVAEINQEIANQQKSQLTLADALSRGDIAAAASAAQEMRAQAAEAASKKSREALDAARAAELANVRSASGLTREQIEERMFNISQQRYNLEKQRQAELDALIPKQKALADLEQQRADEMKKVAELEAEILKIKSGPAYQAAQKALKDAQDALQKLEDAKAKIEAELKKEMANVNAQKAKWDDIQAGIDAAQGSAVNYNTALESAVTTAGNLSEAIKKLLLADAGSSLPATQNTNSNIPADDAHKGIVARAGKEILSSGASGSGSGSVTKQIADNLKTATAPAKIVETSFKNIQTSSNLSEKSQKLIADYLLSQKTDSLDISNNTAKTLASSLAMIDPISRATTEIQNQIEPFKITTDYMKEQKNIIAEMMNEGNEYGLWEMMQVWIKIWYAISRNVIPQVKLYAEELKKSFDIAEQLYNAMMSLNTTVTTTHIVNTIYTSSGSAGAGSPGAGSPGAGSPTPPGGGGVGGGPTDPLPVMYGGKIKKMAFGGPVQRSMYSNRVGSDFVPALLTPGEFVVNKQASKEFGPLLNKINESKFPSLLKSDYSQEKYNVATPTVISAPSKTSADTVSNNSSTVYNYSVGITVGGSTSSPDAIARAVMGEIKYYDAQRINKQVV